MTNNTKMKKRAFKYASKKLAFLGYAKSPPIERHLVEDEPSTEFIFVPQLIWPITADLNLPLHHSTILVKARNTKARQVLKHVHRHTHLYIEGRLLQVPCDSTSSHTPSQCIALFHLHVIAKHEFSALTEPLPDLD